MAEHRAGLAVETAVELALQAGLCLRAFLRDTRALVGAQLGVEPSRELPR